MGMFLNGDAISEPDPRGTRVRDDSFLLLFNAHYDDTVFTLPPKKYGELWEVALDTAAPLIADRPLCKAGRDGGRRGPVLARVPSRWLNRPECGLTCPRTGALSRRLDLPDAAVVRVRLRRRGGS